MHPGWFHGFSYPVLLLNTTILLMLLEAVVSVEKSDARFAVIEEEAMIRQLRELLHLYGTASGRNNSTTMKTQIHTGNKFCKQPLGI